MPPAKKLSESMKIEVAPASRAYYYGGEKFLLTSADPVLRHEARGRLSVYRDLERDAKVYAGLQKRYDMVVDAEWTLSPGPRRGLAPTRADQKAVDMVKYHLDSLGVEIEEKTVNQHALFASDFGGLQVGLMDSNLMGFAVCEVMWGQADDEIYADEIKVRDQTRFAFDNRHRVKLIDRTDLGSDTTGIFLPLRKFLVYTFGSQTDPYGMGLGNRLYWPVWFKRQGMSFWLRFIDKYSAPTAVGKYPPGTPERGKGSQETLLEAAAAVHSDSAVAIPNTMELELLQAIMTAAQQGYDRLIEYLDNQISQVTTGVTLTGESGDKGGSRAMGRVHQTEQRGVGKREATSLSNFLRRTLIDWTIKYNFPATVGREQAMVPVLRKHFPDLEGLVDLAERDSALFDQGYQRTLDSVNEVYGHGQKVYVRHNLLKPAKEGGDAPPEGSEAKKDRKREEQGERDSEALFPTIFNGDSRV